MLSKKSMLRNTKHHTRNENIFLSDDNEAMPEIITLREACNLLKVHPNTLRQWDKKGILVAIRFGERKDRRYCKKDILKLLNQKQQ